MGGMQEILSTENCKSIVEKYLHAGDIKIINHEIKRLTNALDGLIGEQYTVDITYEHQGRIKHLRSFLKTLNESSKIMFDLSLEIRAYEKEDFFYNKLLPEFSKYGINMSFLPNCYLCIPYTVVLEDLSVDGFKCTNKQKPLDLSHCKKSIEILAGLHSAGIIYEKRKAAESSKPSYRLLDDFPDFLNDVLFTKEDNAASRWLKCSIEGVFLLIDMLPGNSISASDFKLALKLKLEELLSGKPYDKFLYSVLHGDLWSNNFLFKYGTNSSIIDTKLVDFQTVKYGPVALDIEQFIMTNTRKPFRDSHESELLNHYYEKFTEITTQQGSVVDELLSRDDLITSCRAMRIPAKIHAIVDRSITFMADELYEELMKDEKEFEKFLFCDRGKYILESYNLDKNFKDLITEDMCELRDLLFSD